MFVGGPYHQVGFSIREVAKVPDQVIGKAYYGLFLYVFALRDDAPNLPAGARVGTSMLETRPPPSPLRGRLPRGYVTCLSQRFQKRIELQVDILGLAPLRRWRWRIYPGGVSLSLNAAFASLDVSVDFLVTNQSREVIWNCFFTFTLEGRISLPYYRLAVLGSLSYSRQGLIFHRSSGVEDISLPPRHHTSE